MRPSRDANLTADEYLTKESQADVRSEYVSGQTFAMTGTTLAHNTISCNLLTALSLHLKGSKCKPYMADVKVNVETMDCFYYPDVVVTCEAYVGSNVFIRSPVLICEILSPSTMHIDRREKLLAYREIPSLKEYLIVHQSKYRVELYQKDVDEKWTIALFGIQDELTLNSLSPALCMQVSEIYDGVVLDSIVQEEEELDYG